MNKIWCFIFICCGILVIISTPENFLTSLINASEKAVSLSISLIAIYAIWLGILELADKCGINKKLSKIFNPLIVKWFGNINNNTKEQICLNISSNILGMGNASTPSGIRGMQGLYRGEEKINKEMILFFLLNTCSLQLIPTTIMGLRITNNSSNASSIIIPTILTSFLSLAVALTLYFLIEKFKRKKCK